MKELHHLGTQDKCHKCDLHGKGFFCALPVEDLQAFELIKVTKAYPKGTMLFVEGQPSTGVYMLCKGRVKLSICSPYGKVIIIGIAEPGEILGISAAINSNEYEATAETLELCQVNYLRTTELLAFLRDNPKACLNVARQLSRNYQMACRQVYSLGLTDSVAGKLASLFLGWSCTGQVNGSNGKNGHNGNGSIYLKNTFTHSDIAEMIGASRESVTRSLKFFRDNEIITLKGTELIIHNRQRLTAMTGVRGIPHSAD